MSCVGPAGPYFPCSVLDPFLRFNFFKIIQSKATVSARKYDANSWLKVNLINGYVFLKYKFGTHPTKLRKTYKSLLREPV